METIDNNGYFDTSYCDCAYCGHTVTYTDKAPPDKWDDDAWAELAKDHHSDCEWILTRAHALDR